jgi:hypothetical protein
MAHNEDMFVDMSESVFQFVNGNLMLGHLRELREY